MNPFGLSREVPCCGRDLPLLQKQRHPLCHVSRRTASAAIGVPIPAQFQIAPVCFLLHQLLHRDIWKRNPGTRRVETSAFFPECLWTLYLGRVLQGCELQPRHLLLQEGVGQRGKKVLNTSWSHKKTEGVDVWCFGWGLVSPSPLHAGMLSGWVSCGQPQ